MSVERVDPRVDMVGWNRQQYLEELRLLRGQVRRYPAHATTGRLRAGEHVYEAIQDLIEKADDVEF